jgi:ferredoxin-NADP reductase/MOSC domain-containing protein YiiM/ferredoxin
MEEEQGGRARKLVSVNVSMPRTVTHEGRHVTTGIFKEPVAARVMVRKLNVDGDGQGDLKVHGGVNKAVNVYDLESYRYWQRELGRDDLAYGQFGENFTVEGMPDDAVHIGDVFQVGSATLEVTQPRVPCFKLDMKMGLPGFSRQFLTSGRLGFYFRVLKEGEVGAGDSIKRVRVGPEKVTVREFARIYYFDQDNQEAIRRILRIPSISRGWRRSFEELLDVPGEKGKKGRAEEPAWQGFRTFIVVRKVPESSTITSFYLVPEDGEPLPLYMPGQFLTVKMHLPGHTKPVIRSYSLSQSPGKDEYYRVTVKRESHPDDPRIITASHYLHDLVEPGERLQVAAPRGSFFIDPREETPVVLISGGVGLTPTISMLNAIVSSGKKRPVWFVHGAINGIHHAMSKHMRDVAAENENVTAHICYSRPRPEDREGREYDSRGHVTVDLLKNLLPGRDMDFYLCAPPPFMLSMMEGLQEWGVPKERIRFELFGPASLLKEGARPKRLKRDKDPDEEAFQVAFLHSGITARWDPDYANLLDLAEDHGVFPDFGCRSGICSTCMYDLVEGEVEYAYEPLDQPAPGRVLLCCTRPKSELVIDA